MVSGETYHIFNRSVQRIPIFKGEREYKIFSEAARFYVQASPPTKFSLFRINPQRFSPLDMNDVLVTVVNYCLMPNHFHFTLRQEKENGIRQFVQRLTNSFAHYFSKKYSNQGPLFQGNFKAVRVETDEQLVHLSRYIHLNPVTSYLVEKPEQYPYSSYNVYLGKLKSDWVDPIIVLQQFKSTKKYEDFVLPQKDYQRTLDKIKHLTLEGERLKTSIV